MDEYGIEGGRGDESCWTGLRAHSVVRELKASCACALRSGIDVGVSRKEGVGLLEGQTMDRAGCGVVVSVASARNE